MNKYSILYEDAWDYSVPYLFVDENILHLDSQSHFKGLADTIRSEPKAFKSRIFTNPNFKSF